VALQKVRILLLFDNSFLLFQKQSESYPTGGRSACTMMFVLCTFPSLRNPTPCFTQNVSVMSNGSNPRFFAVCTNNSRVLGCRSAETKIAHFSFSTMNFSEVRFVSFV
jgi:hypothetical protein